MTYSRDTTAISEITGQPVSTWSEEWRIETEARAILAMSKDERDVFFNGRKDENGKQIERGLIGIRGLKAVEEIRAVMEQLQEARQKRK
jgi:hypothetical protein